MHGQALGISRRTFRACLWSFSCSLRKAVLHNFSHINMSNYCVCFLSWWLTFFHRCPTFRTIDCKKITFEKTCVQKAPKVSPFAYVSGWTKCEFRKMSVIALLHLALLFKMNGFPLSMLKPFKFLEVVLKGRGMKALSSTFFIFIDSLPWKATFCNKIWKE